VQVSAKKYRVVLLEAIIMKDKKLVGHRVKTVNGYVSVNGEVNSEKPVPFTLADAYKAIGAFLTKNPGMDPPVICNVNHVHELTLLEEVSRQCAEQLLSVAPRFGIDLSKLGITRENCESKFMEEFIELGAKQGK
jgi:hypothetical protein